MSLNLTDVNLSSINGSFDIDTKGQPFQNVGWLELVNESPYTLYVQAGGTNLKIPAWYDYPIQLQDNSTGIWQPVRAADFPVTVTPKLLNASINNLSTMLLPVLYLTGETPPITTPQPLVRQSYVPNQVNTVGGVANSVQDDTRTTGSDTIEARVSGDSVAALIATNSGFLQLGNNSGRSGELVIYNGSSLQFHVDTSGNLTIASGSSMFANALNALSANDLSLEAPLNQRIALNINGSVMAQADGTGFKLLAGTLSLLKNSISRIAFDGAYTVPSGSGTFFNHSLGVVPTFCIPVVGGLGSGTFTCMYEQSSMTNTQVKLQGNVSFSNVYIITVKF